VDKPCDTFFVDQDLGRHTTQLEKIDLLPVQLKHTGFGIWKTNKGQGFFLPVGGKTFGILRTDNYDNDIPLYE
jgi:hypothetical protein